MPNVVKATKLGLLRLMVADDLLVLDMSDPAKLRRSLTALHEGGGHVLIWHSPGAARRLGGPKTEVQRVQAWLAELFEDATLRDLHVVVAASDALRVVYPAGMRGLARWEARTHLVGGGRLGGAKRILLRLVGDLLASRRRRATLARIEVVRC
jgi:hypothetical protein